MNRLLRLAPLALCLLATLPTTAFAEREYSVKEFSAEVDGRKFSVRAGSALVWDLGDFGKLVGISPFEKIGEDWARCIAKQRHVLNQEIQNRSAREFGSLPALRDIEVFLADLSSLGVVDKMRALRQGFPLKPAVEITRDALQIAPIFEDGKCRLVSGDAIHAGIREFVKKEKKERSEIAAAATLAEAIKGQEEAQGMLEALSAAKSSSDARQTTRKESGIEPGAAISEQSEAASVSSGVARQ